MSTHFLTLELPLTPPSELHRSILSELHRYGEPLRWAIVGIDVDQRKVQIEAVVTSDSDFLLPKSAITTV